MSSCTPRENTTTFGAHRGAVLCYRAAAGFAVRAGPSSSSSPRRRVVSPVALGGSTSTRPGSDRAGRRVLVVGISLFIATIAAPPLSACYISLRPAGGTGSAHHGPLRPCCHSSRVLVAATAGTAVAFPTAAVAALPLLPLLPTTTIHHQNHCRALICKSDTRNLLLIRDQHCLGTRAPRPGSVSRARALRFHRRSRASPLGPAAVYSSARVGSSPDPARLLPLRRVAASWTPRLVSAPIRPAGNAPGPPRTALQPCPAPPGLPAAARRRLLLHATRPPPPPRNRQPAGSSRDPAAPARQLRARVASSGRLRRPPPASPERPRRLCRSRARPPGHREPCSTSGVRASSESGSASRPRAGRLAVRRLRRPRPAPGRLPKPAASGSPTPPQAWLGPARLGSRPRLWPTPAAPGWLRPLRHALAGSAPTSCPRPAGSGWLPRARMRHLRLLVATALGRPCVHSFCCVLEAAGQKRKRKRGRVEKSKGQLLTAEEREKSRRVPSRLTKKKERKEEESVLKKKKKRRKKCASDLWLPGRLQKARLLCRSPLPSRLKKREEDKVVTGRSGLTAQQSARISGATPSGCAGAAPRRLQTREEFCRTASSRQKRKRRTRALQDASPPGRSSLTGWGPASSTRGLEGHTQRVRRRAPRAPSRAGCLRQTPPRLHEN
ncbi:hypothetical protein VPH35_128290 [Triticum aestivum]